MNYKKKLFNTFNVKKVIVTEHTEFKESWLSYWLAIFVVKVVEFSHKVESNPSYYDAINLKKNPKSSESGLLKLYSLKATKELNWKSILTFKKSIQYVL